MRRAATQPADRKAQARDPTACWLPEIARNTNTMKKHFSLLVIAMVAMCFAYGRECSAHEKPMNEEPMYGNKPFTEEQKKLNDYVVSNVIKEAGSKQAALERTIKLAWQYFYGKNDPETAMKRFNRAWLIDPNNDEVFYGFGFLTSVQGKTDEAISLYKKALELNPNHPMALANLARSYKDKAYALYSKKRLAEPNEEVKSLLGEALRLYEKASQTATSDSALRLTSLESDLSYIYYQWAVTLEFNAEYAKAWQKVKLARKHGGDWLIEPGFLKELSRFMPEPQE